MNNEQRQFVGESYIEMYQSLIDSVKQAGGDETAFYYDEIKDMSISTLFNKLATNGIRFTRVIPEEQKKKDGNPPPPPPPPPKRLLREGVGYS